MIADLSQERTRLRITGADRVEFLHGQCTNDIKGLPVGSECYVAFLNVKGKMRGDGHVLALPEELLLETSAGMGAVLEKYVITEDVVIEDVSAVLRQYVMVEIPPADATERVPPEMTYRHPLGTGVLSPASLPVTLTAEDYELLCIEAGVPRWGVDMDEQTIPVEAGLESAISYDKGCYIGQETIARIRTYGHVNRHLVQLKVASVEVPMKGTKILAGEKEVGQVTSAGLSNRLGKVVALGYVRRECVTSGTQLQVGGQPAEVLKLCAV